MRVKVEIKDNITGDLKNKMKSMKTLYKESLQEFVSLTPIDKGNARRNTKLSNNAIVANYPYAQRLDEGYSKQAPKGMVEPFEKWLDKKIKTTFGK